MGLGTKIGIVSLLWSVGITFALTFWLYEGARIDAKASRRLLRFGIFLFPLGAAVFLVPDPEIPDVDLEFVSPENPSLKVVNSSNAVAHSIRYQAVLWNTSSPENIDPLQLPSETAAFLAAHDAPFPETIFQSVAHTLHKGDRLCGFATISCADCKETKGYLVDLNWGNSGWFGKPSKPYHDLFPSPMNYMGIKKYCEKIDSQVLPSDRTTVLNDNQPFIAR